MSNEPITERVVRIPEPLLRSAAEILSRRHEARAIGLIGEPDVLEQIVLAVLYAVPRKTEEAK